MEPEYEVIQTELDRFRSLPNDLLLVESLNYLLQPDKPLISSWQDEIESRVASINADFSERVNNGLRETISIEEVRMQQNLWETSERYKMIIDPTYGRIKVIGHR